jgi:hypothetical protein
MYFNVDDKKLREIIEVISLGAAFQAFAAEE